MLFLITKSRRTPCTPKSLLYQSRSMSEVIYEVIFGVESSPNYFEPNHEGSWLLGKVEIVCDIAADILTWIGLGFIFKSYRQKAAIYIERLLLP